MNCERSPICVFLKHARAHDMQQFRETSLHCPDAHPMIPSQMLSNLVCHILKGLAQPVFTHVLQNCLEPIACKHNFGCLQTIP